MVQANNGMMHDYSQAGQDDWVLKNTKHYYGTPYFLDMGAYNGVNFSNTCKLEEAGWNGLCIEANPTNFKYLEMYRKCPCVNIAIATYTGILKMSDDSSSSQRSENGEVDVPCDTIRNILIKNNVPKYIDYISSDLERMDAEIWETFPFDEYSFGLATVEHCLYEGNNNFKERIMKVMLENGYVLARENVECDNNPYEDWYMNPKLV